MNITTALQRNLKNLSRMKQQAVKSLLKTLKHIEAERKARTADLDEAARAIMTELAQWGHQVTGGKKSGKSSKSPAGKKVSKRVRRSPEQLKAEAVKVVGLIRSAGKEGIRGGEIRKKFPGVGQNIKVFVQQYTGEKLKTVGQKASMKYHAP